MHEKRFSCIKRVKETVHISLPAAFNANGIAGVKNVLDSWKCQYVQQLKGIVVGYKKVALQNTGFLLTNKPCVHCDVTATFYVFCPSIGSILKGTINRISREHIGCVVHNTVNVTIQLSPDTPEKIYHFTHLDREILFQITHFDFKRKDMHINGQITDECIRLLEELYPGIKTGEDEIHDNSSEVSLSCLSIADSNSSLAKMKKKEKREKTPGDHLFSQKNSAATSSVDSAFDSCMSNKSEDIETDNSQSLLSGYSSQCVNEMSPTQDNVASLSLPRSHKKKKSKNLTLESPENTSRKSHLFEHATQYNVIDSSNVKSTGDPNIFSEVELHFSPHKRKKSKSKSIVQNLQNQSDLLEKNVDKFQEENIKTFSHDALEEKSTSSKKRRPKTDKGKYSSEKLQNQLESNIFENKESSSDLDWCNNNSSKKLRKSKDSVKLGDKSCKMNLSHNQEIYGEVSTFSKNSLDEQPVYFKENNCTKKKKTKLKEISRKGVLDSSVSIKREVSVPSPNNIDPNFNTINLSLIHDTKLGVQSNKEMVQKLESGTLDSESVLENVSHNEKKCMTTNSLNFDLMQNMDESLLPHDVSSLKSAKKKKAKKSKHDETESKSGNNSKLFVPPANNEMNHSLNSTGLLQHDTKLFSSDANSSSLSSLSEKNKLLLVPEFSPAFFGSLDKQLEQISTLLDSQSPKEKKHKDKLKKKHLIDSDSIKEIAELNDCSSLLKEIDKCEMLSDLETSSKNVGVSKKRKRESSDSVGAHFHPSKGSPAKKKRKQDADDGSKHKKKKKAKEEKKKLKSKKNTKHKSGEKDKSKKSGKKHKRNDSKEKSEKKKKKKSKYEKHSETK